MPSRFEQIFDSLLPVSIDEVESPAFSVSALPEAPNRFVGKDNEGRACFLLSTLPQAGQGQRSHIRLQYMEAQFGVRARIKCGGVVSEGRFTIVRCKARDAQINRFFLSSAEAISKGLVENADEAAMASVINRLAIIFQQLRNPPSRSLNGLFGELFIIRESRSPTTALRAWRVQDASRFDFTFGDFRLDAKTSSGRLRVHTFSYDQCNPPPGTVALAASLFIEQISGSPTLQILMDEVGSEVSAFPDLVLKLHETVAATLGESLNHALSVGFDLRLARASLAFFDMRSIPAIRGDLPLGVGDVHFRSDLSAVQSLTAESLWGRYPELVELLPSFH